jgi:ATP-binding cassette subfamily B protein
MRSRKSEPEHPAQPQPQVKPSIRALLTLLLPIYARYRLRLLLGFLALLGVDFLQLTIPKYLKHAVDALSDGTATSRSLLVLSGYLLLTAAGIGMLRFIWRTLIIGFSRRLEAILRDRLFAHILSMDRSFFDQHTPGDIMAHATNDLAAVQMACGMGMVAAADALVISVAALLFMAYISPPLTLLAVLPMPLLAFCTWILSGKLHKRFDQVQNQFALITEFARNTMVSIRLIKGYSRERQQLDAFEQLGKEYVASNLRVAVLQGLLFPVAVLVGNVGMLLILYHGGRLVISSTITLGDFVAFVAYLHMLIWPMMAVGWVTNIAQRGFTSLARIDRLLTARSRLDNSIRLAEHSVMDSAVQPNRSHDVVHDQFHERFHDRPSISFRGLSFSYPSSVSSSDFFYDASVPVLRDLDLEAGPGILGIAGRTGSDKSTLCRLLTRQYPVEENMLFFAGHDVNSLAPALIRQQISYVSQNPVLFSGTVAENISLAVSDASREDIETAAELAAMHTEILAMEDGYQTGIGERGLRLSGGQKQRLAIARALLANRPILIIDDALSALDVETEQRVFAGIRTRSAGRIVLIVSHRLKLLSGTDQVIILDQGRIVAQDSHDQLLLRNAFYQAMARKQQGRAG